jgi:hypothetical protein
MDFKPSKLVELASKSNSLGYQQYSRDALKWFTSKINNLRNPRALALQIKKETNRNTQRFVLGGLYYFYYNAKTASDLPYWDAFPLVIPVQRYGDGFLGINLHYLPINVRAGFMHKLMSTAKFDDNEDPVRVRISYDILAATSKYKEFKPCLKKYLYSQIASKILKVQPNEWQTAVFLPTHQFQKSSAKDVWKDSMMEIKNQTHHANTVPIIGQV